MMFREFFFREVSTGFKRPMVYIFFAIMALMVFGATASSNIVIGGTIGNVYKNAPYMVSFYTSMMSIFALLMATAFFNNAALRDYQCGFNEIIFSSPLNKSSYFFGRFCGALVLSLVPLLGVYVGVILGTVIGPAMGWLDADRMGPLSIRHFFDVFLVFILPNMFIAGGLIFALANKGKNTMTSFMGAIGIIMAYILSEDLMSEVDNQKIAAITDIFGVSTFDYVTKYYTPAEKNTLNGALSPLLLWNRLIWILLSASVLIWSYFNFSFAAKKTKVRKAKELNTQDIVTFSKPSITNVFGTATEWQHFKSFYKMNTLSIIKSPLFKILFVFSVIILIFSFFGSFDYYGLKSYPITYKLVDNIQGMGIFTAIILIFFSGELIWRDRDSNISEVIDATPHTSFISLIAKALSLVSVISLLFGLFVVLSIVFQLSQGFTGIELDVYLKSFFIIYFPGYLFKCFLYIFIQVMLSNKYIGYFVSVLVTFLMTIFLVMIDVSSNMLLVGGTPYLTYSDMNAFGPGLLGANWFNAYWLLLGLILLLFAGSIWIRGNAGPLVSRITSAKKQFKGSYGIITALLGVTWIVCAGFVFYNTQILNKYTTSDEDRARQVSYETKYKKYEGIAIPQITEAKYVIDIYPKERNLNVKCNLKLINKNDVKIDSIHYTLGDWETEIKIPGGKEVYHDTVLDYKIFELDQPMLPGTSMDIEIIVNHVSEGFSNSAGSTKLVKNGTFLNNFDVLPMIGYQPQNELQDKNRRKKAGLKERDRMPELTTNCTDQCNVNYLTAGASDWVSVETIISTSEDQIAIAPGSLVKEWKEEDRNYYHYISDHKSQNFYAFISANYQVEREKWNGIDIEIYYDEKHGYNVADMVDAVKNSLGYYIENFGPYYHKQVRIVEFPRYASFAQAFPGTMPYSEAIGFVTNLEERENNIVDAVIAHEMAHQWWAHQEVSAAMQGATMLTESFSEYSSLMVMKSLCTEMEMKEFLKYNHERYLKGRSRESDKEVPLYKVENQGHIHYGKGSLIMYALQDYIGEDKVNTALRNFLNEYKYAEPPYPNAHDFMRYLEPIVPDSMQYLVQDWFKEITLYDLRVKEADYIAVGDAYEVTISISAKKLKADTMGVEAEVKMNDWIDVGVFADKEEKRLIYQDRIKIDQTESIIKLLIDTIPAKAGIDPRRLLIERVYDDNSKTVVGI